MIRKQLEMRGVKITPMYEGGNEERQLAKYASSVGGRSFGISPNISNVDGAFQGMG